MFQLIIYPLRSIHDHELFFGMLSNAIFVLERSFLRVKSFVKPFCNVIKSFVLTLAVRRAFMYSRVLSSINFLAKTLLTL